MRRLDIALLGTFAVHLDGDPVTEFGYDKVRALLAYLAVEGRRPQRRDTLVGLLWPEQPQREALANLRTALYRLRRVLRDTNTDDPFLLITRGSLELNPDACLQIDTARFADLVAAWRAHGHAEGMECPACVQALAQATTLYRGDLVPGFTPDSEPFEEWLLLQREALHTQALDLLDRLAACDEGQGAYAQALAHARRQLQLEPWCERAHRQVMRMLAFTGQRAAALAQFESCCRVLDVELGIEPERVTRELYERIRVDALQPTRVRVPESPRLPEASLTAPERAVPASSREADGQPLRSTTPPPAAFDTERRCVTLLLVDLVDPGLGQQEAWGEVAGPALQVLVAEARRLEAHVQQTRTAGFTASFGATVAHEDDPERAVVAALAMQQALATYAREVQEPLHLRASVHTAEAVVSPLDDRPAVLGTDLAAFEEGHAHLPPGVVRVAADTYRLVAPLFAWEALDEGTYRPLAHLHAVDKGRGVPGRASPLVGRDRELEGLQTAVADVRAGIGGMVTVFGEAGIGKSRLVAEARKVTLAQLGVPAPLRWVEGRCLSYATQAAYQVWVDVLRALVGVTFDLGPLEVRAMLRATVQRLCPAQFDDVYPLLAWLMLLPLDAEAQSRLQGISAEGLQVLASRAVQQLLEGAAAAAPLVVVLEDLHWADVVSLELLEHLLPLVEQVPLLFVCVMRPVTQHGCWRIRELASREYHDRHIPLRLAPLTEFESGALLRHLLGEHDLPPEVQDRVGTQAEGNPYYLEELVRSLIDAGVLAYDEAAGQWQVRGDIRGMALPATLLGMIAARIDRLPREPRQVLQLAAVIGRIVPLPLLATIAGSSGLDDQLRLLQRAELLRERSRRPEVELIFKHQLVQEAAYAGLLPRKRSALHRRVGETIEQAYGNRIEEHLGLLAHHWEQGGDRERAIAYLRRAGAQAAARFANEEAVSYFSRALALAPDADAAQRYTLLLELEALYDHLGQRERQRETLDRLQRLAEGWGSGTALRAERLAEVWHRRARLELQVAALDESILAAQQTIAQARVAGNLRYEALGHVVWGSALRAVGTLVRDPVDISKELGEAIALARQAEAPDVEAQALREMGLSWTGGTGSISQALEFLGQCLELYRRLGDRTGECLACTAIALVHMNQGQLDAAERTYVDVLEMIRHTGHVREEGWAWWGLGCVSFRMGFFERSLAQLRSAYQVFGAVHDGWGLALAAGDLQHVYMQLGQFDEAEAWGTRVVEGEFVVSRAVARGRLSRLALVKGDPESALRYGHAALAEFRISGGPRACIALFHLGSARAALGDLGGAARDFEEGAQLCRSANWPTSDELAALAGIALARGRMEEAQKLAEQALAEFGDGYFWTRAGFPLDVCLTCWRVLHANGDLRARGVLERAYCALQDVAISTQDEALRRSFLEAVPVHRQIVAAWEGVESAPDGQETGVRG